MADWKTNKGAGPWPFIEQPVTKGYINNPRWTASAASLLEHAPCGYWLKSPSPPTYYDLYGTGVDLHEVKGNGPFGGSDAFQPILFKQIASLSAGYRHGLIIKQDGSLWSAGRNDDFWGTSGGQLGLGQPTNYLAATWERVIGPSKWAMVVGGDAFTAALTPEGDLWTCGENTYGQLGLGDFVARNVLTFVSSGWAEIAAGAYHLLARRHDGSVWGCGSDVNGALGLGIITYYPTFQSLRPTSDWTAIRCGDYTSFLLRSNGTVWCTGVNGNGELGLGHTISPKRVWIETGSGTTWREIAPGAGAAILRDDSNRLWGAGSDVGLGLPPPNRNVWTLLSPDTDWRHIRLGNFTTSSFLIKENGQLWAMGQNTNGNLGTGNTISPLPLTLISSEYWIDVVGSFFTTLGLKASAGEIAPPDIVNPVWTMPS